MKLTRNIVLSMPHPTPPDKVLAAARSFAQANFPLHRYAMVLHTDQKHPHVHLVVKAENELTKRLHIDKAMLQTWREHFAQLMREQGIAANATRRFLRGQTKRKNADKTLRALRRGRSRVMLERVKSVIVDLYDSKDMRDPAREKLIQTRKALVGQWMTAADILEQQGETTLAREVRNFAKNLPTVLTDRERIALDCARHRQGVKAPVATEAGPPKRQRGEHFPPADYVAPFTVFNVGGNNFRAVTAIHYNRQRAYVRHVFTHKEYDDWSDKMQRQSRKGKKRSRL